MNIAHIKNLLSRLPRKSKEYYEAVKNPTLENLDLILKNTPGKFHTLIKQMVGGVNQVKQAITEPISNIVIEEIPIDEADTLVEELSATVEEQQADIFTPEQREEMVQTTEGTELDEVTHIKVLNTEEIAHDEDGNVLESGATLEEQFTNSPMEDEIPTEEVVEETKPKKKKKK